MVLFITWGDQGECVVTTQETTRYSHSDEGAQEVNHHDGEGNFNVLEPFTFDDVHSSRYCHVKVASGKSAGESCCDEET